MKTKLQRLKEKIEPYIYIGGLFVMGIVFIIHLINDIVHKQYDKIDDHFIETVRNYAQNDSLSDQPD